MSEKIATREAYGKALVELGAANDKIVVLDADLAGATMTKYFKAAYPDRFFDCGIAECNMMDIGAGLSTMGLIPFCSTFAMFGAGRAYEQIRNSIAYPKFNVKICCSHAGVSVGEDGGSHQCLEDIGLMRLIPGMTVIVPADAKEARKATFALAEFQGPAYMRTARLATPVFEEDYPFEIGKANVLREGKDVAIFACGLMVAEALKAADLLADEGVESGCPGPFSGCVSVCLRGRIPGHLPDPARHHPSSGPENWKSFHGRRRGPEHLRFPGRLSGRPDAVRADLSRRTGSADGGKLPLHAGDPPAGGRVHSAESQPPSQSHPPHPGVRRRRASDPGGGQGSPVPMAAERICLQRQTSCYPLQE